MCDHTQGEAQSNLLHNAAQQVEEATQDLQQSTEEVLQTRIVPNALVERTPSEWIGAMTGGVRRPAASSETA